MVALQLLVNGLVTGCALGVVAVSFSLIYATTRIFHVAHAGVYTLAGYVAWSLVSHGTPALLALLAAVAVAAAAGALIQALLYARLERRRATQLVILIASLGLLAVFQNVLAAVYTANIQQFPLEWSSRVVSLGGGLRLTWTQVSTVVVDLAAFAGALWFTRYTILGKRIRAVAANPFLAEITRLRPQFVYVVVMTIASAMVALPGVLAVVIAELQNLSLLFIPGEWSIGITFFIFVILMLFRPTGLFAAAR